jgi:integrase
MVVEAGAGLYGGGRITVGYLLDEFLSWATLSPTTYNDWLSVTTKHLKPALGGLPLWKLAARDCDHLYVRMAAGGLGASRVCCAHVVLHRAAAQAVRWGWLPRNPVSTATRPPVARPTITPPSAAAVSAALEVARCRDPQLWCWLLVALATGARRGEVCGIRWREVDLAKRTVRIKRSVSETTRFGLAVKSTKTGRRHSAALTASAAAALTERREAARQAAEASQRELCREEFVFSSDPLGRIPWRPSLVTRS